ncbi:hypothetical protein BKP42_20600 [Rhodococcus erythropolis]|nr:hypothetical protein BKP42_20600 [Rhodococcus erythropolis]
MITDGGDNLLQGIAPRLCKLLDFSGFEDAFGEGKCRRKVFAVRSVHDRGVDVDRTADSEIASTAVVEIDSGIGNPAGGTQFVAELRGGQFAQVVETELWLRTGQHPGTA